MKQVHLPHYKKCDESREVEKCVKESGATSHDMESEDDVEDGNERGEHGDVVEEHEHVHLNICP